ncbi:hypothetical protein F4778DRAFT_624748 [Xylariomycetidae sp. FL2044]|nr:hypothetical protein F4778DRAFT_624748 [Xylariomycetidae sp. FL2044]
MTLCQLWGALRGLVWPWSGLIKECLLLSLFLKSREQVGVSARDDWCADANEEKKKVHPGKVFIRLLLRRILFSPI